MKGEKINFSSVEAFFESCTQVFSERIAYSIYRGDGYAELTFSELRTKAHEFADYLREIGVKRNDPIALLSESSLDWPVAFFGNLLAGATAVPVDPKLTSEVSV
jgi:long-chain acyl-CoA synthetase